MSNFDDAAMILDRISLSRSQLAVNSKGKPRMKLHQADCYVEILCSMLQVYSLFQQLMEDLYDLPAAKCAKVISYAAKWSEQILTRLYSVGHLLKAQHQRKIYNADEVRDAHISNPCADFGCLTRCLQSKAHAKGIKHVSALNSVRWQVSIVQDSVHYPCLDTVKKLLNGPVMDALKEEQVHAHHRAEGHFGREIAQGVSRQQMTETGGSHLGHNARATVFGRRRKV